jgi:hypothetical protein
MLAATASAEPSSAARLIPAGLPDVLLRAVLLAQSDLVSRWYAMRAVARYTSVHDPRGPQYERRNLLSCLTNGAVLAERFPTDIQAVRTLADALPVTVAAPDRRAAADLAIHLRLIVGENGGCESCGGYRSTTLPITWRTEPSDAAGVKAWDGDVNGIKFRAAYVPSAGWQIELNAC